MLRKFFVVVTFSLCFGKRAQDSLKQRPDRFLLSASAGVGFPGSNFTKNDPYPPQAGKAYKAGFTYLPFRFFGFDLSFSKTFNETQIPTTPVVIHFGGLGNPHPYISYVYWSGVWKTSNYCLDAVFQPNTKFVQARLKAGGGIQMAVSPPVHMYYMYGNYSEEVKETAGRVFVFHLGIDVRIKLIKDLGLLLSQDLYDSVMDLPGSTTPQKNIVLTTMGVGLSYSIR